MDYLVHNIAINLNHIRKAKGMSLDAVAEQTGVSKSMLAAIEKGAANPSIGVLVKIMSYMHYGIKPDIVSMAKALGGGMPIGAICAREEVAKAFTMGSRHDVRRPSGLLRRALLRARHRRRRPRADRTGDPRL